MSQWRPRSADEAAEFQATFCDRCERDAGFRADTADSCPISARGFGVALGLEPPPEWASQDGRPVCTAFEEERA